MEMDDRRFFTQAQKTPIENIPERELSGQYCSTYSVSQLSEVREREAQWGAPTLTGLHTLEKGYIEQSQ
jgi:hypothetical protein